MKKMLLIAALLVATSASARDGYYNPGYYIPPVYVAPPAHSNSYGKPRMDAVDAIGNATRRDIEMRNNYEGAMRYQYIMDGPKHRIDR